MQLLVLVLLQKIFERDALDRGLERQIGCYHGQQFSVVGEDDADSPLESSTFLLNQFYTM